MTDQEFADFKAQHVDRLAFIANNPWTNRLPVPGMYWAWDVVNNRVYPAVVTETAGDAKFLGCFQIIGTGGEAEANQYRDNKVTGGNFIFAPLGSMCFPFPENFWGVQHYIPLFCEQENKPYQPPSVDPTKPLTT